MLPFNFDISKATDIITPSTFYLSVINLSELQLQEQRIAMACQVSQDDQILNSLHKLAISITAPKFFERIRLAKFMLG